MACNSVLKLFSLHKPASSTAGPSNRTVLKGQRQTMPCHEDDSSDAGKSCRNDSVTGLLISPTCLQILFEYFCIIPSHSISCVGALSSSVQHILVTFSATRQIDTLDFFVQTRLLDADVPLPHLQGMVPSVTRSED